ncbi:MAG: YraN family protein [Planctomycetaceae bacterium]
MPRTGWLRKLLGDRGERLAVRFLSQRGYVIVARQSRSAIGEIDIIALDRNSPGGETVVFVEVKTRSQQQAGAPTEAVNLTKQRQLTRAALTWLKRRRWLGRRTRFDVVAVLWQGPAEPVVTHYQHAFEAVGVDGMY